MSLSHAPNPSFLPNLNLVDDHDQDPQLRPRKRRRKYIAQACNECKRRKIKCNGQSPCQRCGRQHIDCVYAEPSRSSPSATDPQRSLDRLCGQVSAMQNQIATLSATVHALAQGSLHSRPDAPAPPPGGSTQRSFRRHSSAREVPFQGPTTSAFSFDLAKSSLQRRGIVERNDEEGDWTRDASPSASPSPSPSHVQPVPHAPVDPLWTIGKTEALRLCRVYEEEMGIMYPVLDLPQLLHQVHLLYGPMETRWARSSTTSGQVRSDPNDGEDALDRDDVHILRLVFACALTAEAGGSSELAMALFESVREAADNCVWGAPEIKNIIFLTLVSILYFQIDEETLAWRTIGIVERMCLEKGLHRREALNRPGIIAAGRDRVLRLFWSIYILDMRWSFGTGMPFFLEDSDIDPWLPEPEEKTPYLRVMIRYSRIAAKVWKFIGAFNNTNEFKKDEMNYLDWMVLRWVESMPDELRLEGPPSAREKEKETRSLRRLRALLYLRANQLRMLIHRPVLHSAAHIVRYLPESQTVVDIANDTIRFITRLNATSDIYRLQQVAFNYFLVSALAVLFLAVAQTPAEFSSRCKDEFYMALELVKGFSRSYISRRLWSSIRSLRKLGPQLGLQTHQRREKDRDLVECGDEGVSREARAVDANPSAPVQTQTQTQTPLDGAQMTRELMEWFEAVGNVEDPMMGMGDVNEPWMGRAGHGHVYPVEYGGELSAMMKDCF